MFMVKGKSAKTAMGYAFASLMIFTIIVPASAASSQPKEDINAEVAVQEEVQGDFLCPYDPGLPEQAAAQITAMQNGKAILVLPRANLSGQTIPCRNGDREKVDEDEDEEDEVDEDEVD